MSTEFIILGIIAAGMLIELWAAVSAPVGYQDEMGFHFGVESPDSPDESVCANPS